MIPWVSAALHIGLLPNQHRAIIEVNNLFTNEILWRELL